MSETEVLKPCPFCGGQDIREECDEYGDWRVICHACSASMPAQLKTDAVRDWNTRTQPSSEPTDAMIEAGAQSLYLETDFKGFEREFAWATAEEKRLWRLRAQNCYRRMQEARNAQS